MIYDTRHSEQCKLFIIVFKIVTSITSLFKFYRSGVRFLGLRDPSAPGTVAVRSDLTFTGQTMKTKSRWLEQYEYRSWPQKNIQPSDWGDLQKVDRAGRRDVHRCRQLRCQLPQRSWYQGATRLPQKTCFLKNVVWRAWWLPHLFVENLFQGEVVLVGRHLPHRLHVLRRVPGEHRLTDWTLFSLPRLLWCS